MQIHWRKFLWFRKVTVEGTPAELAEFNRYREQYFMPVRHASRVDDMGLSRAFYIDIRDVPNEKVHEYMEVVKSRLMPIEEEELEQGTEDFPAMVARDKS